jgi:hypothetical protein
MKRLKEISFKIQKENKKINENNFINCIYCIIALLHISCELYTI